MPRNRRPFDPCRPVFFTVCLADRSSTALIDYLDLLREAVRVTKADRPFEKLARVVLPDHMHAVWRLPEEDPNYSQRWGRIKARFTCDLRVRLRSPGLGPGLRRWVSRAKARSTIGKKKLGGRSPPSSEKSDDRKQQ